MDKLSRASEAKDYTGRAKPELVNSSSDTGGNQMQQARAVPAVAACLGA